MQKNNCVEALRFFFIMLICLWHTIGNTSIIKHGDLGVEFFFILSGMMLYKTYVKSNAPDTLEFTIKKINRFIPSVLIYLPVLMCVQWNWVPSNLSIEEISRSFSLLVGEIFNIGNAGLWGGRINEPLWFLSVLTVGSALIYGLLRQIKSPGVWCILISIVLYAYLVETGEGSIRGVGHNTIYRHLVRGCAAILLGCSLFMFVLQRKNDLNHRWRRVLNMATIVSVIGFIISICSPRSYDSYAVVYFCILLVAAFTENSFLFKLFKKQYWSFFGDLSWPIFLTHYPIAQNMPNVLTRVGVESAWLRTSITIIAICLFAYVFTIIESIIKKKYYEYSMVV